MFRFMMFHHACSQPRGSSHRPILASWRHGGAPMMPGGHRWWPQVARFSRKFLGKPSCKPWKHAQVRPSHPRCKLAEKHRPKPASSGFITVSYSRAVFTHTFLGSWCHTSNSGWLKTALGNSVSNPDL